MFKLQKIQKQFQQVDSNQQDDPLRENLKPILAKMLKEGLEKSGDIYQSNGKSFHLYAQWKSQDRDPAGEVLQELYDILTELQNGTNNSSLSDDFNDISNLDKKAIALKAEIKESIRGYFSQNTANVTTFRRGEEASNPMVQVIVDSTPFEPEINVQFSFAYDSSTISEKFKQAYRELNANGLELNIDFFAQVADVKDVDANDDLDMSDNGNLSAQIDKTVEKVNKGEKLTEQDKKVIQNFHLALERSKNVAKFLGDEENLNNIDEILGGKEYKGNYTETSLQVFNNAILIDETNGEQNLNLNQDYAKLIPEMSESAERSSTSEKAFKIKRPKLFDPRNNKVELAFISEQEGDTIEKEILTGTDYYLHREIARENVETIMENAKILSGHKDNDKEEYNPFIGFDEWVDKDLEKEDIKLSDRGKKGKGGENNSANKDNNKENEGNNKKVNQQQISVEFPENTSSAHAKIRFRDDKQDETFIESIQDNPHPLAFPFLKIALYTEDGIGLLKDLLNGPFGKGTEKELADKMVPDFFDRMERDSEGNISYDIVVEKIILHTKKDFNDDEKTEKNLDKRLNKMISQFEKHYDKFLSEGKQRYDEFIGDRQDNDIETFIANKANDILESFKNLEKPQKPESTNLSPKEYNEKLGQYRKDKENYENDRKDFFLENFDKPFIEVINESKNKEAEREIEIIKFGTEQFEDLEISEKKEVIEDYLRSKYDRLKKLNLNENDRENAVKAAGNKLSEETTLIIGLHKRDKYGYIYYHNNGKDKALIDIKANAEDKLRTTIQRAIESISNIAKGSINVEDVKKLVNDENSPLNEFKDIIKISGADKDINNGEDLKLKITINQEGIEATDEKLNQLKDLIKTLHSDANGSNEKWRDLKKQIKKDINDRYSYAPMDIGPLEKNPKLPESLIAGFRGVLQNSMEDLSGNIPPSSKSNNQGAVIS